MPATATPPAPPTTPVATPVAPKTDEKPWRKTHAAGPEERARHERLRAEYAAARPEMRAQALAGLVRRATGGGGVPVTGALLTLKAVREAAGVSLTDLAAKAGMQKSTLSRLENGDRNPTVRTLERVAAALGKRLVVRLEDLPADDQPPADGRGDEEQKGE